MRHDAPEFFRRLVHGPGNKSNERNPEEQQCGQNSCRELASARTEPRAKLQGAKNWLGYSAHEFCYFVLVSVSGSTLLITIAIEPPRWNTLPLTVTRCPA